LNNILNLKIMASKFFKEALSDRKPETQIFIKKYLDLVERIHQLLTEKNISQKELAEALELQPSAISRMLGKGGHNLTLKTISKLEAFFGQEILVVKGK
jgi:predicted XRE-type DNA-binding protein